jgi:putative sugar O-methyltransferase
MGRAHDAQLFLPAGCQVVPASTALDILDSERIPKKMNRFTLKLMDLLGMIAPRTSGSDNGIYPEVCYNAATTKAFYSFRRDPAYKMILEHTSQEIGEQYAAEIRKDVDIVAMMGELRKNDSIGGAEPIDYGDLGMVSPPTLRYIKVLADIKRIFGNCSGFNIVEIGGGYGGQCRVICAAMPIKSYTIIDISPAIALTRRFLECYPIAPRVIYRTPPEMGEDGFFPDLLISNYAFSELPIATQDVYLNKIIRRSRRGYITWNTTPVESYSLEDLIRTIPGATSTPEKPLTAKSNRVILWG